MNFLTIILIAIGLSMDSFAVAITNGFTIRELKIKRILTIAFYLSIFQALMPVIGWFAGKGFEQYIKDFDHWVAFGLLFLIGAKMIYESFKKEEHCVPKELKIITLIGQSVATSIDALAVGISFALLETSIITPVIIIGITTFGFSMLGLYIGKSIGNKFGKSLELIGGLILIGIGIKIVVEHLYF